MSRFVASSSLHGYGYCCKVVLCMVLYMVFVLKAGTKPLVCILGLWNQHLRESIVESVRFPCVVVLDSETCHRTLSYHFVIPFRHTSSSYQCVMAVWDSRCGACAPE